MIMVYEASYTTIIITPDIISFALISIMGRFIPVASLTCGMVHTSRVEQVISPSPSTR